jgi:hypothetical protein
MSGEFYLPLGSGGRCMLLEATFPLECSSPRKELSIIGDCALNKGGGEID